MVAMAMYFYASRLTATAAKTPPQSANSNSSNNQTSSSSNNCKRSQVQTTTAETAAGHQPSISSEKVSTDGHCRCVINSGFWFFFQA